MTQCYFYNGSGDIALKSNMSITEVCANGISCCDQGSICMSNSICRYPQIPASGGPYSGYFLGSCTDSTLESDLCPKKCVALSNPDVVYDYEVKKWACCGIKGDQVACNRPTLQTFEGPPPEELTVLAADTSSIVTSALSVNASDIVHVNEKTSMATNTVITSVTDSLISPSIGPSTIQQSMGNGEKAAIGVGIVLGIVLLFVVGTCGLLIQKRRSAAEARTPTPFSPPQFLTASRQELLVPGSHFPYQPAEKIQRPESYQLAQRAAESSQELDVVRAQHHFHAVELEGKES